MAPIDIVILIVLALGAYEGYKKGLLMSIVGLIGFVIAIILGVYFMDPVSKMLAERLDELSFAFPVFAFLIVFFITLLIVNIAGWILKKMMDMILLGSVDSLAGAILGIVKSAFFVSLFMWLALGFDLKMPKEWSAKSEFLQYIEPLAPGVIWVLEPLVPKVKELQETIAEIVEGFRDAAAD
ncbi:CvpA family protein [Algoriphagus litoralis]|uniref:CvpA family protein n=1 Tax=Algoriphagus litoralis TaxID=2202829 RepID=UPI000DB9A791|nr:CvpA family protein [Algoriphagus litoralis]